MWEVLCAKGVLKRRNLQRWGVFPCQESSQYTLLQEPPCCVELLSSFRCSNRGRSVFLQDVLSPHAKMVPATWSHESSPWRPPRGSPREFLDTADFPDVHKHFIQVWLNGKNNSCGFRPLWSPLNHERAVDSAVSWEEIAGNVKGSSVEDSLPKWENTASLQKAESGHTPLCTYISVLTVFLEAGPFLSCSAEVYVFLVLNLSSGKCPVNFSWLSI